MMQMQLSVSFWGVILSNFDSKKLNRYSDQSQFNKHDGNL